jgi:hypothetical protein
MKRKYCKPGSKEEVPALPITYPFPNRATMVEVAPENFACQCAEEETPTSKTTRSGAPKIVGSPKLRKLLRKWSGHIPVTKQYEKRVLVTIQEAAPEPLTAAELQVESARETLPMLTRNVSHGGSKAGYMRFFFSSLAGNVNNTFRSRFAGSIECMFASVSNALLVFISSCSRVR